MAIPIMQLRKASPPCVAFLCLVSSNQVYAQTLPPPAERAHVYSDYEKQTIDDALASLHATRNPPPEGKTVEQIDVVTLDVFEPRDPVPLWVNVFHTTSRRSVIKRELLVRQGEPYRQMLVDETIHNLRRLTQ